MQDTNIIIVIFQTKGMGQKASLFSFLHGNEWSKNDSLRYYKIIKKKIEWFEYLKSSSKKLA